jgi:hypothetical protein
MANQVLIQASQLFLAVILASFVLMKQRYAAGPEHVASVGWHGGKKKR